MPLASAGPTQQQQPQQPPIERAPSEGTQPMEPSLIPTAHNSSELLVARGDEEDAFFEHLKSCPEEVGIVPRKARRFRCRSFSSIRMFPSRRDGQDPASVALPDGTPRIV
ncbi:hypothetical protein APHAL10511_001520 [Amanita phalloides]|nr:hypothetical protein APHAL10511_001520 [Amanita phalloides]